MATKQYEYFGNQNPTLNDRYNRGRVDAQRLANDKAVLGNINTPFGMGYQIGSAIGNAWADRYNERGVEKGRAEMQSALNDYLQQNGSAQPKTEVEQGGVLNNNMTGTMPSNEMLQNNSANIQGGVLGGLDNAIAPMTPHDAYKAYKNDAWVAKYRGDDPNPDGSAIKVKNDVQAMDQMGDNVDFGKIDKEQAREAVRQQLRANGRTPYQIDQVLGQFDAMYDSKYNKWNEGRATDSLNKGIEALKNNNFDDAYRNLYASAARGNKEAQMQLRRLDYMQNKQDKLDAEERAFQRQLYLKDNYGKGARGGSSSGGSASSGGVVGVVDGSPYTLDMYKADLDAIKNLDPESPVARAANARVLQLSFGFNFRPQGQESASAPSGKSASKETYGFNVTNQDDDNRDSAGPGIFARLGNMIGGLAPEANTSGQARGWASGDFGPSLAERVLGYDPKKKGK